MVGAFVTPIGSASEAAKVTLATGSATEAANEALAVGNAGEAANVALITGPFVRGAIAVCDSKHSQALLTSV